MDGKARSVRVVTVSVFLVIWLLAVAGSALLRGDLRLLERAGRFPIVAEDAGLRIWSPGIPETAEGERTVLARRELERARQEAEAESARIEAERRARWEQIAAASPRDSARAAEIEAVRDALKDARRSGLLMHDIPAEMTAWENTEVTVRLSRGAAAERDLESPPDGMAGRLVVPARDYIRLRLDGGNAFAVEEKSPQLQSLREQDFGEWLFALTPQRGGVHKLRIRLWLYDGRADQPVGTFEETISVLVPLGLRLRTAGLWALSYLFLPLGIALMAARASVHWQLRAKADAGTVPPPSAPAAGQQEDQSLTAGADRPYFGDGVPEATDETARTSS